MKKTITIAALALVTLIGTSAFKKSQTGIQGYTGSPFEQSCNSCHGGASSASYSVGISAVPAFSVNEFLPGTTYTITIDVNAAGFSKFGFGCEILTAGNLNAGTMQNQGSGVKFLNAGQRKNAVHSTPKSGTGGASFSFEWVAPTVGDTATIFVAGNAVNGNANTTGDFPIPPVFMQLKAHDATVGIKTIQSAEALQVSVYPNPSNGLSTLSYMLTQSQNTSIQLINMNGALVKNLIEQNETPGLQSHLLDLHGVASGVYFVKLSANGQKISQKLLVVQ